MAKVKIKIEVNPNADDEELGNIQNQVNNTPSLENVSNVSVKIRGDGIYEEIPSNSGGINGLSLGYALVFDENGYLDNADLEGGVLESTENPVEFVWGVVPESGEYTVRLTFTDAQSLKDITIFGDSEVNQFPTRAIIDGYKEITNDDLTWYINFGNEASTHTIEFTHWNRVNYNACLSKIGITLQYIEIDKTSGLKSVDSTSQSSTDTTGIFYGTVENRGSLEILDKTGELVDMLKDGIIDNSNTKIEVVANNETIQTHISTDSTYNANSQVMSLDLGNRLSSLDILKYKGYDYPDHSERLSVLFFDVLSNLRYALFGKDKELTEDEFKEMLSAKYDATKTLYDYLYSIEIKYPFIEPNKTYREVIDEFCLIAQMQMYIDDDDNVKFVSARPKVFDEDFKAIHIPKSNMFSQLDYAVVLKNKYDGVEATRNNVIDEINEEESTFTKNFDTSNNNIGIQLSDLNSGFRDYKKIGQAFDEDSYNEEYPNAFMQGGVGFVYIKPYYCDINDLITIPKVSNQGLLRVKEITNTISYQLFCDVASKPITLNTNTKTELINSMTFNEFSDSDFKNSQNVTNMARISRTVESDFFGFSNTYISDIATTEINNNSRFSITEDDNNYYINYHILCGYDIIEAGIDKTLMIWFPTSLSLSGSITRYRPSSVTIEILGNVRKIDMNIISSNTENIEYAKTKVSLGSSNLIQDDAVINQIKNNILYDYKNGISNATVSISCSDYYDSNREKAIDWQKGEIPQVNQVVYFDNDLYPDGSQRNWKIKGRTFRKTGVPMVDLELEETKIKKSLSEYSWNEINEISKLGYASSEFSLGDKKTITLQDGREVTAVIIGFNHDTIASDNTNAGITFAIPDLKERSSKGTDTNNATSWEDSLIRQEFLPNLYSNMPLDLQNSIKTVKKVSLNGEAEQITEDNLWLFSISELGGDSNFGNNYDEGKEYKYYLGTLQDLITPKAVYWWLRSCFTHNNLKYNAHILTSLDGFTIGGDGGSSSKDYIMFGFCI